MTNQQGLRRLSGFTLIELITVILVLSVVSIGVTSYIRFGIDIYRDTVGRDRQISDSRFLIERITRELREALPNSVRVNNDNSCIEFVPIVASSSYVDIPVMPEPKSNVVRVVLPADTPELATADKIVVYPLAAGEVYVDPSLDNGKVFKLAAVVPAGTAAAEVTLEQSVQFTTESPTERYYLAENAISYCVEGTLVKRYAGYWPQGLQQSPPLVEGVPVEGVLMAQNQTNSGPFIYQEDTLIRNAVVQLNFEFSYDDEILKLYHEVHVVNVP